MDVLSRLNTLSNQINKGQELIISLPISRLLPYENSPFPLYTGERKDNLVEHIRQFRLINPVIVHKEKIEDRFEYTVLCGTNRIDAFKILGYQEIPCIIKENLTNDEINSIMVGDNLFRREIEDLLPSQLGRALKLLNDAGKQQGKRTDLLDETSRNDCTKWQDDYKLGKRSIQYYIRLNFLNDNLLGMVDERIISLMSGVALSYLKNDEQNQLWNYIKNNNFIIDIKLSELLKKLSRDTEDNISIDKIIEEYENTVIDSKSKMINISFKEIEEYIPVEKRANNSDIKKIIIDAIRLYYFNIDIPIS
jgi:ParB family chromosome partitioning protein